MPSRDSCPGHFADRDPRASLPHGTWRGYYVYPQDDEDHVCWMTLQLHPLDGTFLGTCLDDSGDLATISAGVRMANTRQLRWSKRYVDDGWPAVYRGVWRDDGSIEGSWSFDEPWQIERMRRRGGPLTGAFRIWPTSATTT